MKNSILTTVVVLAIIPILSVCGLSDCGKREGETVEECPAGRPEVYRDEGPPGPKITKYCCESGSDGETARKKKAVGCRTTECLTFTKDSLCSSLATRYIGGEKVEYDEIYRESCKKQNNSGSGVIGYCCPINNVEGLLVATLGAEPNEFPHQEVHSLSDLSKF